MKQKVTTFRAYNNLSRLFAFSYLLDISNILRLKNLLFQAAILMAAVLFFDLLDSTVNFCVGTLKTNSDNVCFCWQH